MLLFFVVIGVAVVYIIIISPFLLRLHLLHSFITKVMS
jgi:hypothetical protein